MANVASVLNGYLDSALRDASDATGGWTSAEKDLLLARAVRNLYPDISYQLDPESYTITLVEDDFFYPLNPIIMSISRVDLVDSASEERGPLANGTWEHTGRRGGDKNAILASSADADDILDTTVAHDFKTGDTLRFISKTGGTSLTVGTTYYVIAGNLAATTLQISATSGGSTVAFGSDITAGVIEGGNGKLHVSPTVVNRWADGLLRLNGYGRYDVLGDYLPEEYVELVVAEAAHTALSWRLSDRIRFAQSASTNQIQNNSVNELVISLNAMEQRARELRARNRRFRKPMPGRI